MKKLPRMFAFFFLLFLAGIGGVTTSYWLSKIHLGTILKEKNGVLLALFLVLLVLTSCNLMVRWFRWHFLTRRFKFLIPIRQSLLLYFATLPMLATPLYVGEMLRGWLLSKKYPLAKRVIFGVWLVERFSDVYILLAALLFCYQRFWLLGGWLILGFFFLVVVMGKLELTGGKYLSRIHSSFILISSSLLAWSLPVLGLWLLVSVFSQSTSLFTATFAFSEGTLLGGATTVPLGVGFSGSFFLTRLVEQGVASSNATIVVFLFRAGTIWFAFSLGLGLFFSFGRRLQQVWKNDPSFSHFDEIAVEYKEQIPEYLQKRLLDRKIEHTLEFLEETPLRGLDIGCGQGWYTAKLSEKGFAMTGLDYSAGQIAKAKESASDIEFVVGSAMELPFEDNSFDFALSINAIHHLPDEESQLLAFQEICRVLKPQGKFFLHEINTKNPLFRLYMSYVFPIINTIDEGIEHWINPDRLPPIEGGLWNQEKRFFTFLPNFFPRFLFRFFQGFESFLESSKYASFSAHYMAILEKKGDLAGMETTKKS